MTEAQNLNENCKLGAKNHTFEKIHKLKNVNMQYTHENNKFKPNYTPVKEKHPPHSLFTKNWFGNREEKRIRWLDHPIVADATRILVP